MTHHLRTKALLIILPRWNQKGPHLLKPHLSLHREPNLIEILIEMTLRKGR